MEIVRQKNAATYIFFPIVDADGDLVSAAAGLDSELNYFADGTAPTTWADCTNEATEIGSSGWYYLSLTQSEMNHDYIAIQIKTTTTGAKTQCVLIRTMTGDPLNLATNTSGRELGVESSGAVTSLSGHTAQTGDTYAVVNSGTYGNSALNTDLDSLLSRITSLRAGYLDNLSAGAVAQASVCTEGRLANLDAAVSSRHAAGAAVSSVTNAVTVGTNNDKSGYSLSGSGVQAIWDALVSAMITANSIGKRIVDFLTGDSYARIGANGAGLTALGDTRLGNLDTAVSTRLATSGYTAPPSAAANADAVWDEALSGHTIAGSAGAALSGAGSAGDPWSTLLPGAYGAGTAGKIIGDNVNATISSRSSHSAADVWSVATRTLTSFGSLAGDIASNVWSAATRTLTAFGFNVTVGTNSDKTGYSLADAPPTTAQIATAVHDEVIESSLSFRHVMRLMMSVLAGKSSGGGTTSVAFRDIDDTKNRVSATLDENGNRTAVMRDGS